MPRRARRGGKQGEAYSAGWLEQPLAKSSQQPGVPEKTTTPRNPAPSKRVGTVCGRAFQSGQDNCPANCCSRSGGCGSYGIARGERSAGDGAGAGTCGALEIETSTHPTRRADRLRALRLLLRCSIFSAAFTFCDPLSAWTALEKGLSLLSRAFPCLVSGLKRSWVAPLYKIPGRRLKWDFWTPTHLPAKPRRSLLLSTRF